MIEPTEIHLPNYCVAQIVSMTAPYGYDYSKMVKNNEILFVIKCEDAIKVIYVSPSFAKPHHQDKE